MHDMREMETVRVKLKMGEVESINKDDRLCFMLLTITDRPLCKEETNVNDTCICIINMWVW